MKFHFQIENVDELPSKICTECTEDLIRSKRFITKIQENEKKLIHYFQESRSRNVPAPPPMMEVESVSATNFEFPEMILNVKLEQQDQDMLDTSDVLEMDDSFRSNDDFLRSDGDDDFRGASSDEQVPSSRQVKEDDSEYFGFFVGYVDISVFVSRKMFL